MMTLTDAHSCKESEGKIVCISMDHLGVTRCVYCDRVVEYRFYNPNIYKDKTLEIFKRVKINLDKNTKMTKHGKRKINFRNTKDKKESSNKGENENIGMAYVVGLVADNRLVMA